MKLQNIEEVETKLKKAGINICLTRCTGVNSFHLIYPCFGFYYVNAQENTPFQKVESFMKQFENINIVINQ